MRTAGPTEGGARRPLAWVAACAAAWFSVVPPLLAEDAAGPDDEQGPVTLVRPAEGATVPAGRRGGRISFAWHSPAHGAPASYFVEVVALGQGGSREVFTGYTKQTELRLRLDESGPYAWRVLGVSRARTSYSVSPWRSFAVGTP